MDKTSLKLFTVAARLDALETQLAEETAKRNQSQGQLEQSWRAEAEQQANLIQLKGAEMEMRMQAWDAQYLKKTA